MTAIHSTTHHESPTSVPPIRARNRADQRRHHAIALVQEHLDVYGTLAFTHPHEAADPVLQCEHAVRIVDAVIAMLRGGVYE